MDSGGMDTAIAADVSDIVLETTYANDYEFSNYPATVFRVDLDTWEYAISDAE